MPVQDLFRDVEPLFRIVYFERPGWHGECLFIGNVFRVQASSREDCWLDWPTFHDGLESNVSDSRAF